MLCYECSQSGARSDAVGVCHHCSAGLCPSHVHLVSDPVTAHFPVAKTVVLPQHARLILCEICYAALHQKHESAPDADGGDEHV